MMEEREEEEERRAEEDIPLWALAPDASLPEEQPSVSTDVSASPAFQCLDELLSLGKISQAKAARLKSSYRRLSDSVKSAQDCELQRLEEAKRCRAALQRMHAELEKAEEQSTSEEPESEVKELRQQLLRAYNELRAAEDAQHRTQLRLQCLWEEKRYLERESETRLKPPELESRVKALQDKNEDLRKEAAQRQVEIRSLTEDVETQEARILREQKELEHHREILELREAEKARLIGVPDQISEKIKRKLSKKEAALKEMEALNAEFSKREQQVQEVEARNRSLRRRREEVAQELEALQARAEASQRECRQLLKEQEVSREEEAELTGSRGILEMKLQNVMSDRKHLYEMSSAQLREKNRQMQALKRTEHALAAATEQLGHARSIHGELQAQLDAVPRREAGIQQRMELQMEVDALKVGFQKQLFVAEEESEKKRQHGMIQELLKESNLLREELHNLRCLTTIKVEERGQKHRELLRAEQLHRQLQHELREKDLIIKDHGKLHTLLQRRLSQYSKLCDIITEEKNKYVKLKEIASQSITELTEQLKVLENETEIQRTIVVNKDRFLTKARHKLSNCSKVRDKLRNDISKVAWKHHQITQESEDSKLALATLTQTTNLQEQALLELNKNSETAVQCRNFLGIQLLEHEEVLFSYHEKVNAQEAAIAQGNVALETLEREMKDLQAAVSEEKRQIELKKREVPLHRKLQGEIATLLIELSEARDKTLECVNRTAAYRDLKGTDPTTAELVRKMEQLKVNLAERERQLLEKTLLVDQVTRLSKPLSERAESCRQDRLSLGKKLNEVRAQIINATQRLMAASAELSVKQAAALSLQQEIKERELQVDRCQRRLEQGLPPCPEMEEEWRRMLRNKRRQQRDKEQREKLAQEDEWYQLPNGEFTTAESRPNAYIPDTDLLPLPKPYGALAPFKPSQPGANMRHFRKPTLKPLEM